MKKRFSIMVIAALLISCLNFSSFASAETAKATIYYTAAGTHLYKDNKGVKTIRTLPVNTKFYIRHKPAQGFYRVTYSKNSGYINVKNLTKSKAATYKDFEGSWYLGKVNAHVSRQILITKNYIYFNYNPEAVIAVVKSKNAVVRNNTLYLQHVTLHGDGTQIWGKLTQIMELKMKNGKKTLLVSKPDNKIIKGFNGTAVIK